MKVEPKPQLIGLRLPSVERQENNATWLLARMCEQCETIYRRPCYAEECREWHKECAS